MSDLLDIRAQIASDIRHARVLYRQAQAMKRDGDVGQEYVNSARDDLDDLIREDSIIKQAIDVEIFDVQLPEATFDEDVEAIRERLYHRLGMEVPS